MLVWSVQKTLIRAAVELPILPRRKKQYPNRPFHNFGSSKFVSRRFLNFIKLADLLIWRLLNCERAGLVGYIRTTIRIMVSVEIIIDKKDASIRLFLPSFPPSSLIFPGFIQYRIMLPLCTQPRYTCLTIQKNKKSRLFALRRVLAKCHHPEKCNRFFHACVSRALIVIAYLLGTRPTL